MMSRSWLPRTLGVVAVAALATACSSGPSPADQGKARDQGAQPDRATPDLRAPDQKQPPVDVGSAEDEATGAWPPGGPFHNGKVCTLPACDPKGAETTDLSGTWIQTITTDSHTCNALVSTMKPVLQKGHVETMDNLTILRAGECVYKDKVGGLVVGVIKGNVMITCEVQAAELGVTPVVESKVTFVNSVGTGPAWTYLFNVPLPPANCEVKLTTTVKRK